MWVRERSGFVFHYLENGSIVSFRSHNEYLLKCGRTAPISRVDSGEKCEDYSLIENDACEDCLFIMTNP